MTVATTDLSDRHPDVQVCDPVFRDFGGVANFHGPVRTLKIFEDNALVRSTLETPGEGRVLVVDAGGSLRCAVLGGNLGQLAVRNGWAGVIVYGCVRDTSELGQLQVGIKALAAHPRKSEKGLHSAHADRAVTFSGVTFRTGSWVYADADGIVVSDRKIND